MLNTPYDGPFDQLPENFIEGETLRDAIVAVEPDLKGRVDRFGNIEGGKDRFLIHPYLLYDRPAELEVFQRCLDEVPEGRRPLCFVITDEEAQRPVPRPLGMIARATDEASPDPKSKSAPGPVPEALPRPRPEALPDVVPPALEGAEGEKPRD